MSSFYSIFQEKETREKNGKTQFSSDYSTNRDRMVVSAKERTKEKKYKSRLVVRD